MKNRTICSNLEIACTFVTPKLLKNRKTSAICISILCKKSEFYYALVNFNNSAAGRKVYVFQQNQINYHHRSSQSSYLAQTLIKTLKHNYYRINIVYLFKNISKNKKHKIKLGCLPKDYY